MISSPNDFLSRSANRKVRKLLGRAYLRGNRVDEAVEVYMNLLRDYPEDTDVMIVLGNLYHLAGSPCTALRLYTRVLELSPGNIIAERQLMLVRAEDNAAWEEPVPLAAEAVKRLAAKLKNEKCQAAGEEIRMAADMVEKLVAEESVAENSHGEMNGQLMPALIEMNIRQARAAGYPELAEALKSLQINLTRQSEDRWADDLLEDPPFGGSPL